MGRNHEHHPAPDHSTDHDDHAAHVPTTADVEHAGHDKHSGHEMHDRQDAEHAMDGGPHAGHGGHDRHAGHSVEMFRTRFWICLVLTIPVLLYAEGLWDLFGLTAPDLPGGEVVSFLLATAIYIYGGSVFLRSATHEIQARLPGMMTLVSVGITAAYLYSVATTFWVEGEGFYWELATLVDIMLLGHWIEMRAVGRAERALSELAKLLPDMAERITGARTEEVPVGELRRGDAVLVRRGGRTPADGEVVDGESDVDESSFTGESRPVGKRPGADAIAGTVNGSGALRIRVTRIGEETALASIVRLVEEAQASKSRAQDIADRAAMVLTYVAIGAGLITTVAWLLADRSGDFVAERAVTVVVIACPHALGLAVPLVIAISTTLAARSDRRGRHRVGRRELRRARPRPGGRSGARERASAGASDRRGGVEPRREAGNGRELRGTEGTRGECHRRRPRRVRRRPPPARRPRDHGRRRSRRARAEVGIGRKDRRARGRGRSRDRCRRAGGRDPPGVARGGSAPEGHGDPRRHDHGGLRGRREQRRRRARPGRVFRAGVARAQGRAREGAAAQGSPRGYGRRRRERRPGARSGGRGDRDRRGNGRGHRDRGRRARPERPARCDAGRRPVEDELPQDPSEPWLGYRLQRRRHPARRGRAGPVRDPARAGGRSAVDVGEHGGRGPQRAAPPERPEPRRLTSPT